VLLVVTMLDDVLVYTRYRTLLKFWKSESVSGRKKNDRNISTGKCLDKNKIKIETLKVLGVIKEVLKRAWI
jgi:hypothetical protein